MDRQACNGGGQRWKGDGVSFPRLLVNPAQRRLSAAGPPS